MTATSRFYWPLLLCLVFTVTMSSALVASSLRTRLLSDPASRSYGPMLLSSSPTVAELLAGIGYGHVVVDMEHSPLGIGPTLEMLRAVDSGIAQQVNKDATTVPIVRMPSHNDVALTKKVLDILKKPAGILFPMVETAADAELAVASTRYPEFGGIRGCAHPFVRASGYGTDENYYQETSRDLLVMVQAESTTAIDNIPEIAAVVGVDCIFLGPFDISCSIGQMGQFSEQGAVMELIRKAEESVLEQAKKRPLVLGGFRSPGRSLEDMFSAGYQFVCGSVDIGLLRSSALTDLKVARKAMEKAK